MRRILTQPTAENVAAQLLALVKRGGYTHLLAPATGFGKNVLPRVAAQARCGADLGHHRDRIAGHVRAADLRGQRVRHRAVEGRDQGDHRAHDGVRRRAATGGSAAIESVAAAARRRGRTK